MTGSEFMVFFFFVYVTCFVLCDACLTLLLSEWPKLYRVLAILSAIGLKC